MNTQMEYSSMEDDMRLAEEFLRTMLDFHEHGNVETLVEDEIKNYFSMSKQIEIYYEKFKLKGYYMSMDPATGAFTISRSPTNSKYDLAQMADKLFLKFCHPSISIQLLNTALEAFITCFGENRFKNCVIELSGLRNSFNMETVMGRVSEHKFNFVAALLMEAHEHVMINRINGVTRVYDLLGELIVEDECAETVVAMFAVEKDLEPRRCLQLKTLLLRRLKEKFQKQPHARIWLKLLSALSLVEAANSFEPFLPFILTIVESLSSSIVVVDADANTYHSPEGSLSYESLIRIMTSLYKNKNSCQSVVNFIFNQCAVDPTLWNSVLNHCHRSLPEEPTPPQIYDFSVPNLAAAAVNAIGWRPSDPS